MAAFPVLVAAGCAAAPGLHAVAEPVTEAIRADPAAGPDSASADAGDTDDTEVPGREDVPEPGDRAEPLDVHGSLGVPSGDVPLEDVPGSGDVRELEELPESQDPADEVGPLRPTSRVAAAPLPATALRARAAAAAVPSLVVSPTTGLDPAGATVTVSGRGYSATANRRFGVYAVFGPKDPQFWLDANRFAAASWVHPGAGSSPGQASMAADGSFTVQLSVKASYTDGNGTKVDCMSTQCYVMTLAAHGVPDRTQDAAVAVSFGAAGAAPPAGPGDPTGGSTSGQSASGSTGSAPSGGSGGSGVESAGTGAGGSSVSGSTSGSAAGDEAVLDATATGASAAGGSAESGGSTTASGSLARTGTGHVPMVWVALGLVASGVALVVASARRPALRTASAHARRYGQGCESTPHS